jgi:transposase
MIARSSRPPRSPLRQTSGTPQAPGLLDQPGIGPVSAAQAIVSFSHPGRCRSDAAFAKLAGTSPIEASSGQTTRHRLNRGGDRALNKALHVIAATRMRDDPTTQAYLARRRTEGKSDREIRRCLKRYIARQLFRALTAAMTPPHHHHHRRSRQHLMPAHRDSHDRRNHTKRS